MYQKFQEMKIIIHDNIHSDYEIAIWSSCQKIWEKTQVKNCNFHRCNNINKYRNCNFYKLYKNNDSAKKIEQNIRNFLH